MVTVAWLVQAARLQCWLCCSVTLGKPMHCPVSYFLCLWNGREEPHALPTCSLGQGHEVQISRCMQKNKHRVMHTCKVVWHSTKSSPKPYFTLLFLWHTLEALRRGHWKRSAMLKDKLKIPMLGFAMGQTWLEIKLALFYLGLKTRSHVAWPAASLSLLFTAKSIACPWVGGIKNL